MFKHSNPFIQMTIHALTGALIGLVAGLIFGVIIQLISNGLLPTQMQDGPQAIAPFLGMGLGTLVGAVLGGIVSLKK